MNIFKFLNSERSFLMLLLLGISIIGFGVWLVSNHELYTGLGQLIIFVGILPILIIFKIYIFEKAACIREAELID